MIMSSEPYSLEYCGVRVYMEGFLDYVHFRFNSPGNGAFLPSEAACACAAIAHARIQTCCRRTRACACIKVTAARKAANIIYTSISESALSELLFAERNGLAHQQSQVSGQSACELTYKSIIISLVSCMSKVLALEDML